MGKFVDLTGKTFNNLTVIGEAYREKGYVFWNCECTCGGKKIIRTNSLKKSKTKSCGCLIREKAREAVTERLLPAAIFEGSNLCIMYENAHSNSGVKGVSYSKKLGKYVAYITAKKKRYYLGTFETLDDATKARKQAEDKYHRPIIERYLKAKGAMPYEQHI